MAQTNRRLEEFQWFEALHRYSFLRLPPRGRDHTKMEVDDEDEDEVMGPDGDLNKQMCNDAVVPILVSSFSNGAYDPYSAKQTRKAVDLIEIVQDLAGKESRKFSVSHFHIGGLGSGKTEASFVLLGIPHAKGAVDLRWYRTQSGKWEKEKSRAGPRNETRFQLTNLG